jgi:hypothetical protein
MSCGRVQPPAAGLRHHLPKKLMAIGALIVAPPREYPEYTPPGYYAVFFKGLERIKYEIVTHSKAPGNEGSGELNR